MLRKHFVTLPVITVLFCIVIWQWMQIRTLQEAGAMLQAQAGARVSAPKPPAGERRRPADQDGQDSSAVAARAGVPQGQENNRNDPERAAREARFREMRAMERGQRVDARMLALKTKLNLTPEQEASVRTAMENGSAEREALRQAMFGRPPAENAEAEERRRREDMEKFAASDAAQESAVTAVMSEEQLAAYGEHKAEQRRTEVENQANWQLGDLQGRLSLTEEQKNAAFQYFAQRAQTFNPQEIMAQGGDVRAALEEQQKAQLEAMRQVLTPEQYELYSKQEEQRAAMFRQNGGGGFGPPPGGR